MSKEKNLGLQKKGNKITYNGGFELDLDRFAEVIDRMMPIYLENEQLYKDAHLFPEFKFQKYFFKKTHKNHLAQMLFLSAYFDHNKWSEVHYGTDMMKMDKLVKNGTLFSHIKKQAENSRFFNNSKMFDSEKTNFNHPLLSERKSTKYKTIIANLYKLSAEEQTIFMKKVVRTIALDVDVYLKKVLSNDKKNNPLENFRGMLEKLVTEYDANPINIIRDRSPKEFINELKTFPGIGPGLAYLTILFYANSGLTPYTIHELDGVDPKIDGNDITVAQITDILKVYEPSHKNNIINALTLGMHETAKTLNITSIDVDLCFWVAAQAYKFDFPSTKSTAISFYSPLELKEFSTTYYKNGFIMPNFNRNGDKIDTKSGNVMNPGFSQFSLFSE